MRLRKAPTSGERYRVPLAGMTTPAEAGSMGTGHVQDRRVSRLNNDAGIVRCSVGQDDHMVHACLYHACLKASTTILMGTVVAEMQR